MKWLITIVLIIGIIGLVNAQLDVQKIDASGTATRKAEWVIHELDVGWEVKLPQYRAGTICLYNPSAKSIGDISLTKNIYDIKGTKIATLISQDTSLSAKKEFGYCYFTFGIEWLKFGEHSTIVEYQQDNVIQYNYDWGQTNFTLLREGSEVSEIFVFYNETSWKFGANDSGNPGLMNYTYVINSTAELTMFSDMGYVEEGDWEDAKEYYYPYFYTYSPNGMNEHRQWFNFKDICSKNYSDCNWEFDGYNGYVNFVSDRNIDPAIVNVSECQTLTGDQYYELNSSMSTDSTVNCLIINGNNITINMMGYDINDSGSAIFSSKFNDTEVYNGTFHNVMQGFYGEGVNNVSLHELNYLDGKSSGGWGTGHTMITKSTSSNLFNSNIDIANNYVNDSYCDDRCSAHGMVLYGITNINVTNNTIENTNCGSRCSSYGILIQGMNNGIINNNLLNNSITQKGLDIGYYSNNTFLYDNIITDSLVTDVVLSINSFNNTFVNCSYDDETVSGSLIRAWWYDGYANDTGGSPIENVNFTVFNSSGSEALQFDTDVNGEGRSWLEEYRNVSGVTTYQLNYTAYATLDGDVQSHSYNVSIENNIFDWYEFVVDTCTAPLTGLWNLLCSDNCIFNENQEVPENISITGNGNITLNAFWNFTGSNQFIFHNPICQININSGGGWT